jgi:uncharacterized membrane protein YqjE
MAEQILKRFLLPLGVFLFLILPMVILIIFCGPDTYEGKVFIGAVVFLLLGIIILAASVTVCCTSIK